MATPPSASRKHLAKRWWGRDGLTLRCTCGGYQPITGTRREQEDAHRAHRVGMGETVKPRALTKVERLEAEVAELRHQLAVEDECVMAPKILLGLGMVMVPAWHELFTDADGNAVRVFAGDAAIRIVTDPAGCTVPLGVVEATVRALREAARRSTPKEG
jgi:hypothetical protein